MTAQWIDAEPVDCTDTFRRDDCTPYASCRLHARACEHIPNDRGTACALCGIPAEMVTPDELADALYAECERRRLEAGGQLTAF